MDELNEGAAGLTEAEQAAGSDDRDGTAGPPEELVEQSARLEDAAREAQAGQAAADPGSTVLLIMTAPAPRRICPPLVGGDYLFQPGEPVEVSATDAELLVGHEALGTRGVTFALAPEGTAVPRRKPRRRRS